MCRIAVIAKQSSFASRPLDGRRPHARHPRRTRHRPLHPVVLLRLAESRSKGLQYLKRISSRAADRDEPTDLATHDAQLGAITRWGIPDPSKLTDLGAITQPTLIANGDNDTMMITENSYLLAHHFPNAQLRIYPDAGTAFSTSSRTFADHLNVFLNCG